MRKITIDENLANELGFKSLRGLKVSLSRTFGKGTYKNSEVSVDKLIVLASKKNQLSTVGRLFKRLKNDKSIAGTTDIYNKAKSIIEEIKIRQGEFTYNDCGVDDISAILFEMYKNKEITYKKLRQTVIDYKLKLPIIFNDSKESIKEFEYVNRDIYTNYNHYADGQSKYSKVNPNLERIDVIGCRWLIQQKNSETDEVLKTMNKIKADLVRSEWRPDGFIELAVGYDEDCPNLCVYHDHVLIGHYHFYPYDTNEYKENDYIDLEKKILRLFKYENIDEKYIELLHIMRSNFDKKYIMHEQEVLKNMKEKSEHWFEKGNEIFIFIQQYSNQGYTMYCYQDGTEINHYTFNNKMGTADFYLELNKFRDMLDDLEEKEWDKYGKHATWTIITLRHLALEQQRKNEEYERKSREENYNRYKNYDYSSLFNSTTTTLTPDEKEIFKKCYKKMSFEFHPDRGGKIEDMQVLNNLRDKLVG